MARLISLGLIIAQSTGFPLPAYAGVSQSSGNITAFSKLDPFQVKLPPSLGKIEDAFADQNAQTVVLIQDAHAIPDAQKSIQKLIAFFQEEYGIDKVAVEGASGAFETQIFKSFPDKIKLKTVFKEYLEKGELTGASAAALFNKRPAHFEGVEDWRVYEEGYAHYLQAVQNQEAVEAWVKSEEEKLSQRKIQLYPAPLLKIDTALTKFLNHKGDLVQTLQMLAEILPPEKDSELELVLMQSRKKNADIQATARLRWLANSIRLAGNQQGIQSEKLREFEQKFQAFQTDALPAENYALYLRRFLEQYPDLRAMLLKQDPQMMTKLSQFSRDAGRLEVMEGTSFFRDFMQYSRKVKDKLLETPEQKKLNAESEKLALIGRLIQMKLDQEDWAALADKKTPAGIPSVDRLLEPALSFYRNAHERDELLLKKTLAMLKGRSGDSQKPQDQACLLIAGGFHTQGITRLLKERGLSYVVIMPAMSDIPETIHYAAQMQGQVSWNSFLRVENGTIDLHAAFVRGTRQLLIEREKPLEGAAREQTLLLKDWRDQIIRDLAARGKIELAGQWTRYIDEIAKPDQEDPFKRQWIQNIRTFIDGLRGLETENRLTPDYVIEMLRARGAALGQPVAYGALSPDARLQTFRLENGLIVAQSAKSEVRTGREAIQSDENPGPRTFEGVSEDVRTFGKGLLDDIYRNAAVTIEDESLEPDEIPFDGVGQGLILNDPRVVRAGEIRVVPSRELWQQVLLELQNPNSYIADAGRRTVAGTLGAGIDEWNFESFVRDYLVGSLTQQMIDNALNAGYTPLQIKEASLFALERLSDENRVVQAMAAVLRGDPDRGLSILRNDAAETPFDEQAHAVYAQSRVNMIEARQSGDSEQIENDPFRQARVFLVESLEASQNPADARRRTRYFNNVEVDSAINRLKRQETILSSQKPLQRSEVRSTAAYSSRLDPFLSDEIPDFSSMEEAGRGGFGTVYHATQVREEVPANQEIIYKAAGGAKRLDLDSLNSSLLREAQILANLKRTLGFFERLDTLGLSAAVPVLLAVGQLSDGRVWFKVRSARDVLPLDDIHFASLEKMKKMDAIIRIAQVLSVAHEAGYVHNDIKPENVLVDSEGFPVIIDWGGASAVEGDASATTRGYSAPDEFMTPASDIYSLGMTLKRLLIDAPKYQRARDQQQLRISETDLEKSGLKKSIFKMLRREEPGSWLTQTVNRFAFWRKPAPVETFESMEEVIEALRQVRSDLAESPAAGRSEIRKPSKPVLGVLTAGFLAFAALGAVARAPAAPGTVTAVPANVPFGQRLLNQWDEQQAFLRNEFSDHLIQGSVVTDAKILPKNLEQLEMPLFPVPADSGGFPLQVYDPVSGTFNGRTGFESFLRDETDLWVTANPERTGTAAGLDFVFMFEGIPGFLVPDNSESGIFYLHAVVPNEELGKTGRHRQYDLYLGYEANPKELYSVPNTQLDRLLELTHLSLQSRTSTAAAGEYFSTRYRAQIMTLLAAFMAGLFYYVVHSLLPRRAVKEKAVDDAAARDARGGRDIAALWTKSGSRSEVRAAGKKMNKPEGVSEGDWNLISRPPLRSDGTNPFREIFLNPKSIQLTKEEKRYLTGRFLESFKRALKEKQTENGIVRYKMIQGLANTLLLPEVGDPQVTIQAFFKQMKGFYSARIDAFAEFVEEVTGEKPVLPPASVPGSAAKAKAVIDPIREVTEKVLQEWLSGDFSGVIVADPDLRQIPGTTRLKTHTVVRHLDQHQTKALFYAALTTLTTLFLSNYSYAISGFFRHEISAVLDIGTHGLAIAGGIAFIANFYLGGWIKSILSRIAKALNVFNRLKKQTHLHEFRLYITEERYGFYDDRGNLLRDWESDRKAYGELMKDLLRQLKELSPSDDDGRTQAIVGMVDKLILDAFKSAPWYPLAGKAGKRMINRMAGIYRLTLEGEKNHTDPHTIAMAMFYTAVAEMVNSGMVAPDFMKKWLPPTALMNAKNAKTFQHFNRVSAQIGQALGIRPFIDARTKEKIAADQTQITSDAIALYRDALTLEDYLEIDRTHFANFEAFLENKLDPDARGNTSHNRGALDTIRMATSGRLYRLVSLQERFEKKLANEAREPGFLASLIRRIYAFLLPFVKDRIASLKQRAQDNTAAYEAERSERRAILLGAFYINQDRLTDLYEKTLAGNEAVATDYVARTIHRQVQWKVFLSRLRAEKSEQELADMDLTARDIDRLILKVHVSAYKLIHARIRLTLGADYENDVLMQRAVTQVVKIFDRKIVPETSRAPILGEAEGTYGRHYAAVGRFLFDPKGLGELIRRYRLRESQIPQSESWLQRRLQPEDYDGMVQQAIDRLLETPAFHERQEEGFEMELARKVRALQGFGDEISAMDGVSLSEESAGALRAAVQLSRFYLQQENISGEQAQQAARILRDAFYAAHPAPEGPQSKRKPRSPAEKTRGRIETLRQNLDRVYASLDQPVVAGMRSEVRGIREYQEAVLWLARSENSDGVTGVRITLNLEGDTLNVIARYYEDGTAVEQFRPVVVLANDGDSFILGRGNDADIQISPDIVSKSHLEIGLKQGKLVIRDLSSNGTFDEAGARLPKDLETTLELRTITQPIRQEVNTTLVKDQPFKVQLALAGGENMVTLKHGEMLRVPVLRIARQGEGHISIEATRNYSLPLHFFRPDTGSITIGANASNDIVLPQAGGFAGVQWTVEILDDQGNIQITAHDAFSAIQGVVLEADAAPEFSMEDTAEIVIPPEIRIMYLAQEYVVEQEGLLLRYLPAGKSNPAVGDAHIGDDLGVLAPDEFRAPASDASLRYRGMRVSLNDLRAILAEGMRIEKTQAGTGSMYAPSFLEAISYALAPGGAAFPTRDFISVIFELDIQVIPGARLNATDEDIPAQAIRRIFALNVQTNRFEDIQDYFAALNSPKTQANENSASVSELRDHYIQAIAEPRELTEAEVLRYLGNTGLQAIQRGERFELRRISYEDYQDYLAVWNEELEKSGFRKGQYPFGITETVEPEDSVLGLIRVAADSGDFLEGYLSVTADENPVRGPVYVLLYRELFHKNIGSSGLLRNPESGNSAGDLLFDDLVKQIAGQGRGLESLPGTEGSRTFHERRKLEIDGAYQPDQAVYYTPQELGDMVRLRGLETAFEGAKSEVRSAGALQVEELALRKVSQLLSPGVLADAQAVSPDEAAGMIARYRRDAALLETEMIGQIDILQFDTEESFRSKLAAARSRIQRSFAVALQIPAGLDNRLAENFMRGYLRGLQGPVEELLANGLKGSQVQAVRQSGLHFSALDVRRQVVLRGENQNAIPLAALSPLRRADIHSAFQPLILNLLEALQDQALYQSLQSPGKAEMLGELTATVQVLLADLLEDRQLSDMPEEVRASRLKEELFKALALDKITVDMLFRSGSQLEINLEGILETVLTQIQARSEVRKSA